MEAQIAKRVLEGSTVQRRASAQNAQLVGTTIVGQTHHYAHSVLLEHSAQPREKSHVKTARWVGVPPKAVSCARAVPLDTME